jgi:hypothetical protein
MLIIYRYTSERLDYFQLQFGMSAPEPVRARFWVPSASMVMMRVWARRHRRGRVGEGDVAAVGGPGGEVAAADVVGELDPLLGGDLHDVDVLSAGSAGAVLTIPGEGEELAVGGPGDRGCIAAVGHAGDAGAVGVHDVELGKAGAAADPGDLCAGLGVVGGRDVGTLVAGDAVGDGALGIGDPDLGIAGA